MIAHREGAEFATIRSIIAKPNTTTSQLPILSAAKRLPRTADSFMLPAIRVAQFLKLNRTMQTAELLR